MLKFLEVVAAILAVGVSIGLIIAIVKLVMLKIKGEGGSSDATHAIFK